MWQALLGQAIVNKLTRELRRHAPVSAWARRLGVNRVTLQNILATSPRVRNGNAAQRLIQLVQSLKAGEWKWVCIGDPRSSRNYIWEGEAKFERDSRPSLQVSLQVGRAPSLDFRR